MTYREFRNAVRVFWLGSSVTPEDVHAIVSDVLGEIARNHTGTPHTVAGKPTCSCGYVARHEDNLAPHFLTMKHAMESDDAHSEADPTTG